MGAFKEFFRYHLATFKWFYAVIGILLVVALYLYISKNAAERQHFEDLSRTKIEYEEKANLVIAENAKKQLTLLHKAFVWAVRSALIRDNLDEVNQYFYELIKEKNVKEIVLADVRGNILASTNKKQEGKPFTDFYPEIMLQGSDVFFQADGESYHVAAPVLSLNSKLGTLFINYQAEKLDLGEPKVETGSTTPTDTSKTD